MTRHPQQQMLQAVARRRQWRGYVGCTNIGGHRDDQDDKAQHVQQRERPKGGGGDSSDHGCEAERRHAAKKQQQNARKKLVLPLLQSASSMSSSSGSGERERDGNGSTDGQHVERNAKSYKDEVWYKSPIGFGSKASVVLAALKLQDTGGTGFISCRDVVKALQGCNFGLKEHQIRSLISRYDSTLREDSTMNYATFARTIKFSEAWEHEEDAAADFFKHDDVIFRQQSYVAKIREHANQLAQKNLPPSQQPPHLLQHDHTPSESPLQAAASPPKLIPGLDSSSRDEDGAKKRTGSNAPSSALPSLGKSPTQQAQTAVWSPGQQEDVNRLSFEFDKQRRANRAHAKASTLLAHINRIEAFAKQEQIANEQHENLRLAAKAMHRHDHYARVLEVENHNLRMLQKQCKGRVKSELTRTNHNVSKDLMFYVDPE